MSPLCHTSLSKWTLAAGATIKSDAKIERYAKVAGEVVCTVTLALNDFFEGKSTTPVWQPPKEIEHCVYCHRPDLADKMARDWNQQRHMEWVMCHTDPTK